MLLKCGLIVICFFLFQGRGARGEERGPSIVRGYVDVQIADI